jgi:signal transduction histidine kinase
MRALEQTAFGDDPVVVEYELPSDDPHSYEARIVRMGADRCLSIVRDITALKRAAKLNHDLARRLISSQEAERQRIARELHDDISQRLAALKIEIDRLAAETGSERSPARLRELSALASEIAGDVHRMSYELHPSKLQLIGLVAALKSLCGDVSKQRNLDVVFTQAAMPPAVDADVSLCVYRIVQEALHNVARHSRARGAQVSVKGEQAHIVLEITDAGDGFDPAQVSPTGLGLIGMHERVAGLNGRLTIDTAPGRGTRITARIPHAR